MTTPNNTVAGLAEKWRMDADGWYGDDFNRGRQAAALKHADELEAALASPAPSAGVGCACGNCEVCDGAEAIAAFPAPSAPPSVAGDAGELSWPTDLGWPDKPFTVHDEPGEHDPCWLVMPGGESIALNHHAINGVDQARAHFIADACNARRLATAEQPGSAVQRENLAWALEQGGILADWCNVAGEALRSLLVAYERRARSSCMTEADLASEPWRCAEYVQAEQALKTKPSPSVEITTPPPAPAAEQGGPNYSFGPYRESIVYADMSRDPGYWNQPEARGVDEKYNELILAVGMKHHGESRHETALRYIRSAEDHSGSHTAALAGKDGA